ncbi:MAG: hypothetical protein U0V74_10240 [Chitinophagales bacterium]
MKKLFTLLVCCCLGATAFAETISIIASQPLRDSSITGITLDDVQELITEACGCKVTYNDATAPVVIILPAENKLKPEELNAWAKASTFPYRNYPKHDYSWKQYHQNNQTMLELRATSLQGISFGLYGLLQEKLGFKFYHPRNTVIPKWNEWPLKGDFTFTANPLFDKKGFHLHTQHHTELAEQLLDPTQPHALADVKEYINWLARNGQTYFEFCLLESIDRKAWPAYAKEFVDYCHQRGIQAAVDLSLHMIQQKTFQLYKGPTAKKEQIDKNLKWLMTADWDFINMEFSTAEFIAGNYAKKEALRQYIIKWLAQNSNTKLMGRQHVVKHENEQGGKRKGFEWDSASTALDLQRGVLSHTVMFYSMTEPHAPVYENENQRHQFEFLLREHKIRETWYYPESAYWVTFDNSVPMTLLPYLSARLSDIDTCVHYNIPGHITFSSGWEWGYWLFDWSIARWSWQYTTNGVAQKRTATMYADELLQKNEQNIFKQALNLQQEYLKDKDLMRWMTAMTITDEIGIKALNDEYHPRPKTPYKYIQRKATQAELDSIKTKVLPLLNDFANESFNLCEAMDTLKGGAVAMELKDGISITGLRAAHRSAVLEYIIGVRENKLKHVKVNYAGKLEAAEIYRMTAQKIVQQREQHYRYPLDLIAANKWDHTSYHFGYLYPVHELHFWHREEEEARKNKYSPLFMNIWNMWRIAGIIN